MSSAGGKEHTKSLLQGMMNQTSDFGWHFINFHYRREGFEEGPNVIPHFSPSRRQQAAVRRWRIQHHFFPVALFWKSNSLQNVLPSRGITGARSCKQVRASTKRNFHPHRVSSPIRKCFLRFRNSSVSMQRLLPAPLETYTTEVSSKLSDIDQPLTSSSLSQLVN